MPMALPDFTANAPLAATPADAGASGAIGGRPAPTHVGAVLSCLLHGAVVAFLVTFGVIQGNAGAPDASVPVELIQLAPPQPAPEPPPPEPIPQKPQPPKPQPAKAEPAKPLPPQAKPAAAKATAAPEQAKAAETTDAPQRTEPAAPLMTAPAEAAPAPDHSPAVSVGKPAARQGDMQDYALMVWQRVMRFKPARVPFGGEVKVRFVLAPDGTLLSAELAQSSGSAFLDRAALDAVNRAAPFPPPPSHATEEQRSFVTSFQFR